MIDAQSLGVDESAADHMDKRQVTNCAKSSWTKRRQTPTLTITVMAIWWTANFCVKNQNVLPTPGIKAAAIESDSNVSDYLNALT
jgi:hypothetical protein